LASFLCADANTINELIFARAIQGVGAAAILGTNIALVRLIYAPEKLGIGLGINAFVVAGGLAGGPVISSIILSHWSWHWLFFINIPVGISAFLLSCFLRQQQQSFKRKFNFLSAILTIVMFSSIIYGLGGISVSNSWGWVSVFIIIGCVSGLLLIWRDSKHLRPIFPVDLCHIPIFSLSVITAFFAFITQGLVLVALPYIFSKTGYSEGEIGFLIAPWPLMGAIMAPIAGSLSNKISAAYLGAAGLMLLGTSIGFLALFQGEIVFLVIVIAMFICGFGFGLFLTPNQRMLMSNVPINRSGAAGGMLNVARTSGQAVGAALVGVSIHLNPNNLSAMLWIGASFALIAAIISILRIVKG
jgi:DHA2 family multidrug resistance protein-like MFS transporter